jgi:CubicO group peptidase (beta-lactamase class C family)
MMIDYSIPGAALGLVQNGKVIYTKGYGVQSTTTKTPVTENSLFNIGSVTKSFTALGIMQLVDQGKLDLDTPVVKYLPDFKLSDPAATQKLTLRHLLSHTSGLPTSNAEVFTAKDRQQAVAEVAKLKLIGQPGQTWQYSNQNYLIAGAVIERITGQTWEEYTRQQIFSSLGMKTANFDTAIQKLADFAAPHQLDVLEGMQRADYPSIAAYGPAGSINASVKEMAEYVRFQVGDGSFDGQKVVSTSALNLMHTQQIAAPALPQGETPIATNLGYGLGWLTEEYRGYQLATHDGSDNVFFANVFLAPAAKSGLVILTNAPLLPSTEVFSYAASLHLTEWLLGLKPEQDLAEKFGKQYDFNLSDFKANLSAARSYKADPTSFQALLGDYSFAAGKLSVILQDSKLYLQTQVGQTTSLYELVPFKTDGFLVKTGVIAGQVIEFKTDANGTVLLYQQGNNIAQKLGKNAKTTEYKDPQGRFSAVLPIGTSLQTQGEMAIVHSTNPGGVFVLTAVSASSDDLLADTRQVLNKLDPSFNLAPVATQNLPMADGRTWTQYLYQLPNDQSVVVVAVKDKGTVYVILGQAKNSDVPALTGTFSALLAGFKIKV